MELRDVPRLEAPLEEWPAPPAVPQDVVVEDEHLVAGLRHRLQHPVMENRVAGDPVRLLDDEDPEAGPLGAPVVLEGRLRCGLSEATVRTSQTAGRGPRRGRRAQPLDSRASPCRFLVFGRCRRLAHAHSSATTTYGLTVVWRGRRGRGLVADAMADAASGPPSQPARLAATLVETPYRAWNCRRDTLAWEPECTLPARRDHGGVPGNRGMCQPLRCEPAPGGTARAVDDRESRHQMRVVVGREMFAGKRILITGGTGSLGQVLARRLLTGAEGIPRACHGVLPR